MSNWSSEAAMSPHPWPYGCLPTPDHTPDHMVIRIRIRWVYRNESRDWVAITESLHHDWQLRWEQHEVWSHSGQCVMIGLLMVCGTVHFCFCCDHFTFGNVHFSNPGTLSFGRPYINVTSLSSCKADIYVTNTTDSSSRLTIHVWIMISICLSSPRYPITVTDADNTPPFYNNTTFQGN